MEQLGGLLMMFWPALVCVPLASFASGRRNRRLRWATAPLMVALSAILSLVNAAVLAGPNTLYRDLAAIVLFGALAPAVAALAGGQRFDGAEASLLRRLLGCIPGWLVAALTPLGVLIAHCTSGDCV